MFLSVLIEQAGIPVPAVPVLFGIGALAAMGQYSWWEAMALAIAACLISDSLWYGLGRRKGQAVLKVLCRISLEPESCVSLTRGWFERLGAGALLVAKFVPGFSSAAQPMAGVTGIPYWKFALADVAGAALWSGAYVGLGYLFHDQAAAAWDALARMGSWLAVIAGVALGLYIGLKYWQRTIYIRALRGNRITPVELFERLQSEEPPVVFDLRRAGEVQSVGLTVPTARWIDVRLVLRGTLRPDDIPEGRDIVLLCS